MHAAISDRDPRWRKVMARDRGADGAFVYAVTTTGVYCRPSCPSRRAKPANVRFFATGTEAAGAGFRPCKRCKPDQATANAHVALIARACRTIESAGHPPALAELAQSAGLSAFHFHRLFKRETGVTPKAYAAAHRTARVRKALKPGVSVTSALYDAGYNASSRFYADADATLGMRPRDFKAGGTDTRISFAIEACSLGFVLVAATDKGLCAILLGDKPNALQRELESRFPRAVLVGGDAQFAKLVATVVTFVDKPALGLDLPLDIRGTAFQRRVWEALRKVPAGKTATYTEIARAISAPGSVRAVAGACAANPLAVVVPCHRIVRTDGDLAGYRWGIARKRALLKSESSE